MDDKIKRVRELSAIDKDPRQFPPGSAQEHSRVAARWELLALAPALAPELGAARKEIAELRAQNNLHMANIELTINEASKALDALRVRAEKAERERDEAREVAEIRRNSGFSFAEEQGRLAKQYQDRIRELSDVIADDTTQIASIRARLADLERWREQAGPVVEVVRELQGLTKQKAEASTGASWDLIQKTYTKRLDAALSMPLPDPPKVTQ